MNTHRISTRLTLPLLCGLALLLWAAPARAQIALQDAPVPALAFNGTNIINVPFTVTSGASVLVAVLADINGNAANAEPATLSWIVGGTTNTLAKAIEINNGAANYRDATIYYLYNPTPGTGIITNLAGAGVNGVYLTAYTLNGVDTTAAPLTGSAGSAGNAVSSLTFTVANVPALAWAAVGGIFGGSTVSSVPMSATGGTTVEITDATDDSITPSVVSEGYISNLNPGSDTFLANPGPGTTGGAKMNFVAAIFKPLGYAAPVMGSIQPQQEILYAGRTAVFQSAAVGLAPLTYNWQSNNVPLTDGGSVTGSATNTLTISNVTLSDAASYQLTASNSLGTNTSAVATLSVVTPVAPYEIAVANQNPVAFYEFDDVNNPASGTAEAFDYAGGFNGVYGANVQNGYASTAGPTTGNGFPGFASTNLAAQFATGAGGNFVQTPAWNLNTNTVTLVAWLNPAATQQSASTGIVVCDAGGTVAGLNYNAKLNAANGGYDLGYIWNNDPKTSGWDSGLIAPAGQWSMVTLVVTATNATIYLMNANGLTASAFNYSNVVQTFNASALIGDDSADGGNGARSFNGIIDDVAVFNKALTGDQVAALFYTASGQSSYAPVIGLQPVSQLTIGGGTASFYVGADGSAPLSYQWAEGAKGSGGPYTNLVDGNGISGSKTATLTIANAVVTNAGDYVVTVSNTVGSPVASSPATLSVLIGLAPIGLQDGSTAITTLTPAASFNVPFTVTVGASVLVVIFSDRCPTFTGHYPATLTWNGNQTFGPVVHGNYGSANYRESAIYYLYNPTPGTSNITGTVRGVGSETLPSNDQWTAFTLNDVNTNFPPLTGETNSLVIQNITSLTFNITNINPYSWAVFSSIFANSYATTSVTDANGITAPLTYSTSANSGDGEAGYANLNNLAAGTDTFLGTQTSAGYCTFMAVVFKPLTGDAPTITAQPQSEILYTNRTANFQTAALGTQPITYHWQSNGVTLHNGGSVSGATTTNLTISGLVANDSASYSVVVTNGVGAVTSSIATLSVIAAVDAYQTAALNLNPFAFYEFDDINDPSTTTAEVFDDAGGFNGVYGAAVQNGLYGTTGPTAGSGFPGFASTNLAAQFASGIAGNYVQVPAWNLNTNAVTLVAWLNPTALLQAPGAGIVVCDSGNTVAGLNYTAILNANTAGYDLGYIWNNDPNTYCWDSGLIAPAGQWSMVTLVVAPTNASIYLMNANGLTASTHAYPHVVQSFSGATLIGEDSADGGAFGQRSFNGTIDNVTVYNKALTGDQVAALFYAASGQSAYAPVIGLEPVSRTVTIGNTAQFYVGADGSEPLTYQWAAGTTGSSGPYTNLTDGNGISGSKSATLTIANVGLTNALDYVVTVANTAAGSPVVSSPATLSVTTHVNQPIALQDGSTSLMFGNFAGSSVTNYSQPFTVTPGATVLVVCFWDTGTTLPDVGPTDMFWNGQHLTQAVQRSTPSQHYRDCSIYYLYNPTPGTGNITFTLALAAIPYIMMPYTLSGVDTFVAPLTNSAAGQSVTSLTFNEPGVAANSWAAVSGYIIANTSGSFTEDIEGTGGVLSASFYTGGEMMGYLSGLAAGNDTFMFTEAGEPANMSILTAAIFKPFVTPPTSVTFNDNTNWTLQGTNITPTLASDLLTLTDNSANETASAFYNYPQYIEGFDASFTYTPSGALTGDGVTFCVQNDPLGPAAIGASDISLGYGNIITNSVAFELNIEASAGGIGFDFGTNGVAVNASYTSVNPVSLASGHPVNVNLYYSQDAMRVKLVDTVNSNTYVTNITTLPDFASVVGNTLGYIGFTGGDGTKTANQTITNFTFVPVIPAVVSISASGGITISWSGVVYSGLVLQQAYALTGPWSNVATPPTQVGTQYQVTLTPGGGSEFYRLELQ